MKTALFAQLAACVLAISIPVAGAYAQQAGDTPDEPDTVVLSDTLHYDDVNRTSTFTGNVILTRGAMTLRADKLVTREDEQGQQHGTATMDGKGLVRIRQENPEKFEVLVATGIRADYDGAAGTVTITGQATVIREICGIAYDNVRGSRIVYNEKTATYQAFGGQDSAGAGGRVRSMAQPQSRIDAAIARCKAGKS